MREQLARNLRVDEEILWQGKPVRAHFIFAGLVFIPVGLAFLSLCSISIFWLNDLEIGLGASSPFTIFGALLILFGLVLAAAPPIAQFMRYGNTEYIITDQRLITQTGSFGLKTRFIDLDKIQEVYVIVGLIDKFFGTGSIIASTAGGALMAAPGRPALTALKEPYEVEKTLEEAMERARKRQSTG